MSYFVPVVDQDNKPLMPTGLLRARRWIDSGRATPFYKKGIFCVKLNVEPSNNQKQDVVVGLDPGSKREAYTIKSKAHTYINILTATPDWVKKAVKQRRNMRRARRFRNTRYRPARFNNRKGAFLPPSTKARWQFKLNILKTLIKILPITDFIVEDIKAKTKGKKKWDQSFSPLEVGKNWFYGEIKKLGTLTTKQGYETKELRDELGLKKSSSKLSDKFECHNVDSWVLANSITGGHSAPENKSIIKIIPLRFHRRQLHVLQFAEGGVRKLYGGTHSLGFKRGSLVKHKKYGLCYVGGTSKGRISVHSIESGKRISTTVGVGECRFMSYSSVRSYRFSSHDLKVRGFQNDEN